MIEETVNDKEGNTSSAKLASQLEKTSCIPNHEIATGCKLESQTADLIAKQEQTFWKYLNLIFSLRNRRNRGVPENFSYKGFKLKFRFFEVVFLCFFLEKTSSTESRFCMLFVCQFWVFVGRFLDHVVKSYPIKWNPALLPPLPWFEWFYENPWV